MARQDVYYADYLQLDKILDAQYPESDKEGVDAHDEMLFIVIHQAYELWFKQILFEVDSISKIMSKSEIDDNAPDLHVITHRLERVKKILDVLVQQVDIIETMTPLDFLDFRDLLRPASGFQSIQFKFLEARLGLKFKDRHGKDYYISHLKEEDKKKVAEQEAKKSIIELVNDWLERLPFFDDDELWADYNAVSESSPEMHKFWSDYRSLYAEGLLDAEKGNVKLFDQLFFDHEYCKNLSLSPLANRRALFIMLYRDMPLFTMPHKLLTQLLDLDELLSMWRFRHVNMVHRIIGTRVGTGGSSGKDYLRAAMDKHYIFKDVAQLTSFLIPRNKLPKLSNALIDQLSFEYH